MIVGLGFGALYNLSEGKRKNIKINVLGAGALKEFLIFFPKERIKMDIRN